MCNVSQLHMTVSPRGADALVLQPAQLIDAARVQREVAILDGVTWPESVHDDPNFRHRRV